MTSLLFAIASLSLIIWLGLLVGWGQFWRADQRLPDGSPPDLLPHWPAVAAVIPARNEAALLPQTLPSLLTQTYPGRLSVVLIDDQSSDGTAAIAAQIAQSLDQAERLTVLTGQALAAGWTGKLWAMEQGWRYLLQQTSPPDYVLFTDADIQHDAANLQQLVHQAQASNLDLVSLMVRLRCQSFWETLLIPAFVFFFQMLYPFPWVNQPGKATAAAAGGCILIRRERLEQLGGLACIRQALIDDCSLAAQVKRHGPIWLGLSTSTHSLRPYPSLHSIWEMVARTAYTQLHYSPLLLAGTVVGMALVYGVPPAAAIAGLLLHHWATALVGIVTWLLMALAYWPTLRLYDRSPGLGLLLPAIATLYTLMTLDSARRHWNGQGGAWKGRIYSRKTG